MKRIFHYGRVGGTICLFICNNFEKKFQIKATYDIKLCENDPIEFFEFIFPIGFIFTFFQITYFITITLILMIFNKDTYHIITSKIIENKELCKNGNNELISVDMKIKKDSFKLVTMTRI